AHLAGIKQGDVVMKVDGEDVTTLSVYDVVKRIRGAKGTEVVLTIFRPDLNETREFAIIRDVINPDTATYVCGTEPIRGFGKVWREHPEVHDPLGCPFTNFRRDEHATRAAVQTFEHGWMLWLETDTVANVDPIYVFFEDDGTFLRYGDRKLVDAHGYAPTPAGFYKVGDRFAKVYWEEIGEAGRQRLGYATNEARDSLGAFQEFQNGRMFWAGEADTIYVIYRGYMDLDGDGRTSWTQAWTSFEDTFEADPAE
ncbi:MAG: PDZ domain-containing protein, partial [Anaerolineae bacterium]|nr:PDZ domain-containing protein [Anaerolineae bacterium]